jgi:hypothetical protein
MSEEDIALATGRQQSLQMKNLLNTKKVGVLRFFLTGQVPAFKDHICVNGESSLRHKFENQNRYIVGIFWFFGFLVFWFSGRLLYGVLFYYINICLLHILLKYF